MKRNNINKESLFSWYSLFLVIAYHLLFLVAALVCRFFGLNDFERVLPFVYSLPASVTILVYLLALIIRQLSKQNPQKKSLQLYQERVHWQGVGALEGIVIVFSFFLVLLLFCIFL